MFTAIAQMLAPGEELDVKIVGVENGVMKIVVMPKATKGGNVALAAPIALAATPEELDSEFVGVIGGYAVERTSLQEQLAVTATLMANAKKDAAAKGTKALQSNGTKALKGPVVTVSDGDDGDDVDHGAGDQGDNVLDGGNLIRPAASQSTLAPAARAVPAGNDDLADLIG